MQTPKLSKKKTAPPQVTDQTNMLNMSWLDESAETGDTAMDLGDLIPLSLDPDDAVAQDGSPIEYTEDENPEEDARRELSWAEQQFKDARNNEKSRMARNTDSEFWLALVFQNREELDAFIQATHWCPPEEKYVDGRVVAKKLGISIPLDKSPFGRRLRPADTQLLSLTDHTGKFERR